MPWALLQVQRPSQNKWNQISQNLKTPKCHETGQIGFLWLKVYILVASKLRSFPTSPNSVCIKVDQMAYAKSLEIFMRQEWQNFDMWPTLEFEFTFQVLTYHTKKTDSKLCWLLWKNALAWILSRLSFKRKRPHDDLQGTVRLIVEKKDWEKNAFFGPYQLMMMACGGCYCCCRLPMANLTARPSPSSQTSVMMMSPYRVIQSAITSLHA